MTDIDIESIRLFLEIATYIITILGVPIAIYSYIREQNLQREEREYGTYDSLDDKYIELQQLCLEYPELDIFDTPFESPPKLNEQQKKQEEAILLIRISIFERAYLMYERIDSKSKQQQWMGWEIEMKEWLKRKNFRELWIEQNQYFDQGFAEYLNQFL